MDNMNKIMAVIVLGTVLLGAFMYFGVSAGSKDVEFIDIRIKTGSVMLKRGVLFSQAIQSIDGFNEVVIYGKVKTNRNIEKDDVFIGLQFTLSSYKKCKCPALSRYPESHTFPNPNSYILVLDLAGMEAGDVTDFKYTISREVFERWLQTHTRASLSDEGQVESWIGKAYLAIVKVPTGMTINKMRRYMYGLPVVVGPLQVEKRVKVFDWEFNARHYKFHSIVMGDADYESPDWPLTHEILPQSVEMSVKVTNSGAIVLMAVIALSFLAFILGFIKLDWEQASWLVKLVAFIIILIVILLIPRLFGVI